MISVKVHAEGDVIDQNLSLERISDCLQIPQSLLWVDVVSPTPDEMKLLAIEFGFHPLALEDASVRHERPKVDEYESFLLIIFYALGTGNAESLVDLHQLSIFAGTNFVVTMHNDPLPILDQISRRWLINRDQIKFHDTGLLVYSILDALVDGYMPVIDSLSDRIDQIEDDIFGKFDSSAQQEIFHLKRDLLTMRKVLTPERDVLNSLIRRDTPIYNEHSVRYFQDIYDHLLRVLDSIDTFRDLLSSALDSYVSVVSNRMNSVMKTLTASSIILMSMTLIAGVYGMNFVHMPELDWRLGYPMALGGMVAIGVVLGIAFKQRDWF